MNRRRGILGSIVTGAVVVLVLVTSAVAGNKPGNSLNSKMCQKGGWQSLYTRTGQPFASEQACTSYGAQGGQLINQTALACLNDGWKTLGPSATTKFASEQECVDYAVGGGSPVAQGADVRVTYVDSAAVMCVTPWNPAYCFSKDVWVYNDGPATATTVSIDITDTEVDGAFGPNGYSINNNFCTVTGSSGPGNVTLSCTVTNVAAPGGGAFLFRFYAYNGGSHTGSATVTSSSPTDPTTSNNTVTWDLTAPSVPT